MLSKPTATVRCPCWTVPHAWLPRSQKECPSASTVSSAEVARGKPSPDVYVEAITRLRIEAAWSAAVEDSSNGVRAAAAAGLRVVAVAHDQYPIAADALALVESVHRTLGGVQDALIRMLDNPAMEARPR